MSRLDLCKKSEGDQIRHLNLNWAKGCSMWYSLMLSNKTWGRGRKRWELFFFFFRLAITWRLMGNNESLLLHHLVLIGLFYITKFLLSSQRGMLSPFCHLLKCLYLDFCFLTFSLLVFSAVLGCMWLLGFCRTQPTAGYFCCIIWLFLKPSDHWNMFDCQLIYKDTSQVQLLCLWIEE